MEAATAWGRSPFVGRLVSDIAQFWHEQRIPILLSTFVVLLFLRIYLHRTSEEREKLLVFPKIYGTEEKPVDEEEKKKNGSQDESGAAPKPNAPKQQQQEGESRGPRRIRGQLPPGKRRQEVAGRTTAAGEKAAPIQILVFFSSLTGHTEKAANDYAQRLGTAVAAGCRSSDDDGDSESAKPTSATFLKPKILDLSEADYDEYFITAPQLPGGEDDVKADLFYVFLIPSYNIDSTNDTFLEHLRETHHDFRIDNAPLSAVLGYSVFGFGDKEGWPTEEEGFCFQAKEVDKWMAKLTGRKRAYPLGMGDPKTDGNDRLGEWHQGLVDILLLLGRTGSLGEGVPGSGEAVESDDEAGSENDDDYDDGEVIFDDEIWGEQKTSRPTKKSSNSADIEDLGGSEKGPIAIDFTTYKTPKARTTTAPTVTVKKMVPKNSPTYAALTKQGYSIVGSHSGVKICRWTKSALRGRGSCYKFSFYGINSHQCMETTPSLSCSNKCVFCWRHGTNPVGTSWRWVVDPPQLIFDGVKANHYKKISQLRGVPGVRAERFAEAMRIRHCALSLVGEPIFYPHINEFLALLHGERISSFLVCNAQHPDQLAALHHVTQLYVSIDASDRDSLRRIDRPLHRDFWERFQRCLDILRARRFRQRTVFRLTLVKGFNVEDEAAGYADLVERALPCFVEIKGVTYCGKTTASAGLTMANVPFWHEVRAFVEALDRRLRERGLAYGIAAEHAHSCCALIASDRFRGSREGRWRTLIDYDRFFALLQERGPDGDFAPEDYMGEETPDWAAWGMGGFDPRDQRVDRKGRPIEVTA